MSDDYEEINYDDDDWRDDDAADWEDEDCDYGFEFCVDPLCKQMGNCGFECELMLEEIRQRSKFCPGCEDRVHWYQRKFVDVMGQRWHRSCWRHFEEQLHKSKEAAT
jgi:hypothetical protein